MSVVYSVSFRRWYTGFSAQIMFPKLMKNSLEKISLIQILGGQIFIAIVSKRCKEFKNIFVFLKKQS